MQEHARQERVPIRDFGSHKILCTMSHSALPMTGLLVVADCWRNEPDAEAVIQRAIAAASEAVGSDIGEAELAVMLTDDSGIRTLNNNWRGIDKPTNVLSFPALQPEGARKPGDAPRGRRGAEAVQPPSQPSCGAWLSSSGRLRP